MSRVWHAKRLTRYAILVARCNACIQSCESQELRKEWKIINFWDPLRNIEPVQLGVEQMCQASVELPSITDDTGCGIQQTLYTCKPYLTMVGLIPRHAVKPAATSDYLWADIVGKLLLLTANGSQKHNRFAVNKTRQIIPVITRKANADKYVYTKYSVIPRQYVPYLVLASIFFHSLTH